MQNDDMDHLGSKPQTPEEHDLIIELMRSPEVKFKYIIEAHLTKAVDKSLFLYRLDDIFTFYYNLKGPGEIHPFSLRPKALDRAFEVVIELQKIYTKSTYTHREYALAHEYKIKIDQEKTLSREDQRKHGGKRREKAFDSLNPKSINYKQPTKQELQNVVILLDAFPEAISLVTKDLQEKD